MRNNYAQVLAQGGGLAFYSSYDPALVSALKAQIPHSERKWDPANKAWIVGAKHAPTLAKLAWQYLDVSLDIPKLQTAKPTSKMLKLEYLGAVKDRGEEETAFGWCDGDWTVIIPLIVLQSWFCVDSKPGESQTLFSTLGISRTALDNEIKTAFRRLARQWHPDVCKEPDAHEQFMAIKNAYDVLSNPNMRARYEAGLQLVGMQQAQSQLDYSSLYKQYRPPLRCGWLLAEGIEKIGRFVVSRIVQWEDITNRKGQTMVSYWPAGGDKFEVNWI